MINSLEPMGGSRNFREGGGGGRGGPGQSDKKALTTFFFFFSPQLILQKSNGNYHFSRFRRGSNIFQEGGGVQHFPGGGVQLLIPYRNPYNL